MKPIYVIGPKNPDVDAVVSAIAYARLKTYTTNGNYVAAAAGELNPESRFILQHLGFKAPALVTDVGAKVEDLLDEELPTSIHPDATLVEVGNLLRAGG